MSGDVDWDGVRDRISRLSVTETSRDGAVRVTVSASGVMTDLVLRDRWHQPQALSTVAAEIMECLGRAQARIPDLLRETMFDAVGSNDPAVHLVVADAKKRFPEPAPDGHDAPPAPRPPAPKPKPARRSDDGWEEERTVLEDVI